MSLADVAELTQVTRPAVSNWRRRHEDFPQPVRETGAVSLFPLADIQEWLTRHGKKQIELTARQEIWRALSVTRGRVTVTRSAEICLWVLGMYALNDHLDEDDRLQTAGLSGSDHADLVAAAADVVGQYMGITFELEQGEVDELAPVVTELPRLVREYGAGEVCEALIAEASERQGKGSGQYVTTPALAELMTALAQPVEGLVYDPGCGWGTVLTHIHRNRSTDRELYLAGDDILPTARIITTLRMLIHGATGSIGNQDAATARTSRNADFVFTDPPFGGQVDTWMWLERTVQHLADTGRGFHLTPMGPLFWSGPSAQERRRLVEQGSVEAVIALPAGLYPHTAIPAALWLLRPPGNRRSTVLLVDGSGLGIPRRWQRELTPTDIKRIVECHRAWERDDRWPPATGLPCRAVAIEELVEGDCRLDVRYWVSPEAPLDVHASRLRSAHAKVRETTAAVPPMPEFGELRVVSGQSVLVRDLGDVIRGVRVPQDLLERGSTPVMRTADLRNDWTARPSTTVDLEALARDVPRTRPGDVLVVAHDGQVRAGVDDTGGAIIAAPLQVVRLRKQSSERALLLAVLLSTAVPGTTTVSYADIRDITVSWPTEDDSAHVTGLLRSVVVQRTAVRQAATAADELLDALVAAVSAGLHPALPGGLQ